MVGAAALLATTVPVGASVPELSSDAATTYVTARAAAISGEHAQAAELFAQLAATSKDSDLSEQAVSEAIRAGDFDLALKLISNAPQKATSIDSRLLVVADALRRGRPDIAEQWLAADGEGFDLGFWVPMVKAWAEADKGQADAALARLGSVPPKSAFSPFVDQEVAFILLKVGKPAQAESYARRAIANSGSREFPIRLALAAGFDQAGDRSRALQMIDGIDADSALVRKQLLSGQLKGQRIDTAAKAFSEQLLSLALEIRRARGSAADPVDVVQIARYAAPENSDATITLGVLLDDEGSHDKAIEAFRSVPAYDPLKTQSLDAEARSLVQAKRFDEALATTEAATRTGTGTADDYARLGDVLSAMKRYGDAADAYDKAIARTSATDKGRLWPLLLLRASALESADRWPETKVALQTALQIAPDEPLILNFLGYAKLEHGEDMDTAEALIRKASKLAPEDASITDSLGWALFKRGRIEEAIETLQNAAATDPAQSEIQEHLGDALYTAGLKFRARYAWRAALATADDEAEGRLKSKIESGLTQSTAAH
jgi:tetratricopeptide (TPR) repeat protein